MPIPHTMVHLPCPKGGRKHYREFTMPAASIIAATTMRGLRHIPAQLSNELYIDCRASLRDNFDFRISVANVQKWHKADSRHAEPKSAIGGKADIASTDLDVRFWPKADIRS